MRIKVLIVDDEIMICRSLEAGLTDLGYEVSTAQDCKKAIDKVQSLKPFIVLTDMRLGNENGIDLIEDIKKIDADTEVIVMTAYSDISSAVSAIKKGAFDYINKPFDLEQIRIVLNRAYENYKLKKKILIFEKQNENKIKNMIGQSTKMKEVYDQIDRLSQNDNVTVFIKGETGTGKELVADAIHRNSIRRELPILKLNCSALPNQLVESELFGYERNAFTGAIARKKGLFELANGGTVFLDELGEIPLETQAKLLRVLEERKFRRLGGLEDIGVDIRIITATNKNLELAVKEKEFREDLYYRINVVPITVPPLRERGTDIILLAEFFLNKYNSSFKKSIKGFDEGARQKLLAYSWPGNVRELKNVIERIVILMDDDWITSSNLPLEIRNHEPKQMTISTSPCSSLFEGQNFSLDQMIDSIERNYLIEALELAKWNQTKAASILGISRFALKRKMEKHNLIKIQSDEL